MSRSAADAADAADASGARDGEPSAVAAQSTSDEPSTTAVAVSQRRWPDPLVVVAAGVVAGVAVVALHRLRLGLYVVSGALSVGAILRLVLRPRVARSLVVRSRQTDFLILAAAAVAIAVVAAVTPLHTAA